ncbi:MAG: transcription initiation factor IIB family protein [Candidatus Hodarchaeota archaeon]
MEADKSPSIVPITLCLEDEFCPECGETRLIREWTRGEIVCTNCGLVVATTLDTNPEWRAFSREEVEQSCRVGAPLSALRPDYGLQTQIGGINRDSRGAPLAATKRMQMNRLRQIDRRAKRSEVRNLRIALRELKRLCSQLGISRKVAESAAIYYRKALKKGLVRGRSIDGITAAAVYLAARNQGTTLTIRDIVQMTRVTPKELGRCVRVIIEELGLKTSPTDPRVLVQRLGNELKLTMNTQKKAIELIEQAIENNITIGKNPISIAAATLYIACVKTGERRTQHQIAKAANTTPVTIRNRFKELEKKLKIENLLVKRGAAAVPVYKPLSWPNGD